MVLKKHKVPGHVPAGMLRLVTGDDPSEEPDPGTGVKQDRRVVSYTPVVILALLVDLSGSTAPFARQIRSGVLAMLERLRRDMLAATMVRIALGTITDPVVICPFHPVDGLELPDFHFSGSTPLFEAHTLMLDALESLFRTCASEGNPVVKCSMATVSDWHATDAPGKVVARVHAAEKNFRLNYLPIMVSDQPNLDLANTISSRRRGLHLDENHYPELFEWFSEMLVIHSRSTSGQEVDNPSTDGWRRSQ